METKILSGRFVTVEEFVEYLIDKNVSTVCPSCGQDNAFISSETDGENAVQTRADAVVFNTQTMSMGILPSVGETIISLSVVCDSCGYIRSFSAQNVYKWLDEKQKTERLV